MMCSLLLMDSHANDAKRLLQKLSFQVMQWNTIGIDWNYKPTCTSSSVKAQNFQEIPISSLRELYLNGNW